MNKNTFKPDESEKAKSHLRSRQEREVRQCSECAETKRLVFFKGRLVRRLEFIQVSFSTSCKECLKETYETKSLSKKAMVARAAKAKIGREDPKNELKLNDVRVLLECPCYFCGSRNEIKIERKHEAFKFSRANSVPICKRCRAVRTTMPYSAWKHFAPIMRNLESSGEFSGWDGLKGESCKPRSASRLYGMRTNHPSRSRSRRQSQRDP